MALPQAVYRTALRAAKALSPAMMRGDGKLARGLRGRRDAHEWLKEWREEDRSRCAAGVPAEHRLVWVHASSVGESLQARAVVERLRARVPELRVVFTFFSPSAEIVCADFPADVCSYLPWDLPEVIGPVLDAVRPDVIVFTQREVWPTLVDEATARGVPTVLVAGTLPEGAGRLSRPGRILLRAAFQSLRAIAVVSEEDGHRFRLLGVQRERITVAGDPGIDAARDRAAAIDLDAPHMRLFVDEQEPVLVAGSTWPSDEDVLVPALARARAAVPGLRLVLVPHEPGGCDFAALATRLATDGWTPACLSQGIAPHRVPDAILVDRVGVLPDLYKLATVAFVGGGFHSGGLHSVLEPAAVGVPVLVGPGYQNSLHAARLVAIGAARVVADADALVETLRGWLEVPKKKEEHGRRAADYIEAHQNAAERSADLITQFFPVRTRRRTPSDGET
jgi:3-deoxy-D-manno-octulosonic-acid transferase